MSLIIHSDDYFFNEEDDQVINQLITTGTIESVSVMAVNFYQGYEKQLCYLEKLKNLGLHFCIVDGYEPLSQEMSKNLFLLNGRFPSSLIMRLLIVFGLIKKSSIRKELDAQIQALLNLGLKLDHIDSHGHIHKWPRISGVITEYAVKNNLKVRPAISIDIITRQSLGNLNKYFNKKLTRLNLSYGDNLVMPLNEKDRNFRIIINRIMSSKGTIVLGLHPGKRSWRLKEAKIAENVREYFNS